jgi:hypothetical protein
MPETDPASLAAPDQVARKIIALVGDAERAPTGTRLAVATAETK